MRIDVLDVLFDNTTMDTAVEAAMTLMEEHRAKYAVTPNPEIVWLCRKDDELKIAVENAAMVLPDGIGVIYGAKILGTPLNGKVSGADFAEKLMGQMEGTGKTVFLLGSKPGVAEKAAENLKGRYPALRICGTADGYFKDDASVIEKVNAVSPDLLLVCLGAPKQEKWMYKNASQLDVGLMAGLGGTLDVIAGTVKRAPEAWQRFNLEWLYRLIKQPKRFFRMMKLPAFLLAVVWRRLTRGKANST